MLRYCKYDNCRRILVDPADECPKCYRRRLRNGIDIDGFPARKRLPTDCELYKPLRKRTRVEDRILNRPRGRMKDRLL